MRRLIFAPAARDDLIEIAIYIADDNPVRAETFGAKLEAKARQAADRPAAFQPEMILPPASRPPREPDQS
jgi:toxin ParE1/3/4